MDHKKQMHEHIEHACDKLLAQMLDDNDMPQLARICIDAFRRCYSHWELEAGLGNASLMSKGEALSNALAIVVFNFVQLHARNDIEAQNAAAHELIQEVARCVGYNLLHTYGVPDGEEFHKGSPTEGNA